MGQDSGLPVTFQAGDPPVYRFSETGLGKRHPPFALLCSLVAGDAPAVPLVREQDLGRHAEKQQRKEGAFYRSTDQQARTFLTRLCSCHEGQSSILWFDFLSNIIYSDTLRKGTKRMGY